jgi:CHAT domain-containing protein
MREHINRFILVFLILFSSATPAYSQASENDGHALCTQGLELIRGGLGKEGLELIKSGLAALEIVDPSQRDPQIHGMCASMAGVLAEMDGDQASAELWYLSAVESLRRSDLEENLMLILWKLGDLYHTLKNYGEAARFYVEGLELAENLGDQDQKGLILNDLTSLYIDIGDYTSAYTYGREALTEALTLGDIELEATAYYNIGKLEALGRNPEAVSYYLEAVDRFSQLRDFDSLAHTYKNIADAYLMNGEINAGEQYSSLAVSAANKSDDPETIIDILNLLGQSFSEARLYHKAQTYIGEALNLARAQGNRMGESWSLIGLAGMYSNQGHSGASIDIYRQALAIAISEGLVEEQAIIYSNLATEYIENGFFEEAIEYYLLSLETFKRMSNTFGEGTLLGHIGHALTFMERYDEALAMLKESLEIGRRVNDRFMEGAALSKTGYVYMELGLYEKAEDFLHESNVIYQELNNQTELSQNYMLLAMVYAKQGKYSDVVGITTSGKLMVNEKTHPYIFITVYNTLAFAHENLGEIDEALEYYHRSLDILEELRASRGAESFRASFLDEYNMVYRNLILFYADLNQPERAFEITERSRARAFLDSLATGQVQLSDDDLNLLLLREIEAYQTVEAIRFALAEIQNASNPDSDQLANIEEEFYRAKQNHASIQDEIRARGENLESLIPMRQNVPDFAAIQSVLGPATTLVSYYTLRDNYLVFVVDEASVNMLVLEVDPDEVWAEVQVFHRFDNLAEAYPKEAVRLHDMLVAPIRSLLNTPHLLIVPHGALHYLPFAGLTDGSRYLLDDFSISYLPSASVLLQVKPSPTDWRERRGVVVGNPKTDPSEGLSSLVHAEKEAQFIGSLFEIEPLLGEQATPSQLKNRLAGAAFLHLAAHGRFNTFTPLESYIALAPEFGDESGLLKVSHIFSLDLSQTDLVVLSACQTQIGNVSRSLQFDAGDELVNMTRSFLVAGASSVVGTLWSVEDRPTELLMAAFYTHYHAGVGKAEALRLAQLEVRQSFPNPFYWAAFSLSGDPGEILEFPQTEVEAPNRSEELAQTQRSARAFIPILAIAGMGIVFLAVVGLGGLFYLHRKKY